MVVNGNQGSAPNYEPNSVTDSGVKEDPKYAEKPYQVSGLAQRNKFTDEEINYVQPRAFWTNVMKEENKVYLCDAMAGNMKTCR
jgi:catalase